jgi:DNA polymerase IV
MIFAHIDMDCFFCACEEKHNPNLKGKPVIVGGKSSRSVVSSGNYIARKYKIKAGMPISKAKQLCPDAIFISGNHNLYKKESAQVMEILAEYSDQFKQASIDEAYLEITEISEQFGSLEHYAEFIQKEVEKRTQLTCSIGIAESKIVAKIASDFKKPNGYTIVKDQQTFLENLPIGKIPGIGKVSRKKYYENKIYKIGDLRHKDKFFIMDNFGKYGLKYYYLAKGNALNSKHFFVETEPKSFSRERTFETDLADRDELLAILKKICYQVHSDLQGYYKTVSIKVRFADFSTITRDKTIHVSTNSLNIILDTATDLFLKIYDQFNIPERKVRLLGVKVSSITIGKEIQKKIPDYCNLEFY